MGKAKHAASSSRTEPKEKTVLLRLLDGTPTIRKLRHMAILLARPMSLGVRVAAFDAEGAIFLVRHTYMAGWYMPGGGVDPGETAEEAARRELREEGNLDVIEAPRFVSVHFNRPALGRDHVLFLHAPLVRQSAPRPPDREIAESGFFSVDALPPGMTPGTRRRLDELLGRKPRDPDW